MDYKGMAKITDYIIDCTCTKERIPQKVLKLFHY